MKIRWNKQYTLIAIYSIIVLCCAILFYLGVVHINVFFGWVGWLLSILKPIIYACAFAYVINPFMEFFEKLLGKTMKKKGKLLKMKRGLSVFFAYASLMIIVVFMFYIVIPQLVSSISNFIANIPNYVSTFDAWAHSTLESFSKSGLVTAEQVNSVTAYINNLLNTSSQWITDQVPGMLDFTKQLGIEIYNIFFGLIISIYVLLQKESFAFQTRRVLQAVFPRRIVSGITDIVEISDNMFGIFLRGRLLEAFIIGVLCFIGMLILGTPYSMLISTIIGITNIIPYFGPFIGAIPSILIILIIDPMQALWFGIFLLALQQFDGNFLGPKILGDSIGISAFWVITSIIVGGGLFGVIGMFLGVPAFGVISTIVRKYVRTQLRKKGYVDEGEEEVLIYEMPKEEKPRKN